MSGIPKTLEVLVLLLMVLTDPVPAPDRHSQPKIVASPTTAQPPPVVKPGDPVPLDVGKFVWLDVQGHAGPISWDFSKTGIVALPTDAAEASVYGGIKQGESAPQWHKPTSKTAVPCMGVSTGSVTVAAWAVLDGKAKKIAELVMQVGPAPPKPVDPDVPDVKPVPVTSFRVFIVFESGKNYTPAEMAVMSGKVVEEWLDANCTGGNNGWRRRDQSIGGEKDPKFAQLWAAIQPAITTLPAFAVEVNDKVKIIPLEKTPAEMVAKLKLMREGK